MASAETHHRKADMTRGHYRRLLLMAGLSFLAMYGLMYAMVDQAANVYANLNQLYMAALMTAPMVLLELGLMGSMYPSKKLNRGIAAASAVALVGFWLLIRQQTAISDAQFLRSMIPHHAGAILMCEKAAIKNAQIVKLCGNIESSQQAEIAEMKAILARLQP